MNKVMPPILKSKKDQQSLIAALDIGTSKVVVIVAEIQPDGVLKIIGKGQHVSKGLKKTNVPSASASGVVLSPSAVA